ncbi:MAG: HAD-IIIA family hydrolase [Candidatus Atribacteria bacterium]|nr:HAD-IIIA family hydrolase [Candidatus Atribacteria bacterium]
MKEQKQNLKELGIDETWTLFLDRDGVINKRIEGDYVRKWSQFKFLPSTPEAIRRLSKVFGWIIVVTNQRGVSRNLIRDADLLEIHKKMGDSIIRSGGRIDRVYVCPHDLQNQCNCRKPKPGLALEAKRDFPSVNFSKSIVIGDDDSDVVFAKALNMKSVLILDDDRDEVEEMLADFIFRDLLEFSLSL